MRGTRRNAQQGEGHDEECLKKTVHCVHVESDAEEKNINWYTQRATLAGHRSIEFTQKLKKKILTCRKKFLGIIVFCLVMYIYICVFVCLSFWISIFILIQEWS